MTIATQAGSEAYSQSFQIGACVPDAVAARAKEHSHRLAISAGDETLDYAELDGRSDRLARHLRSMGAGPGIVVGLCMPRTLDMVVGALAILKTGGAYLPMDPDYPDERLLFLLADAQAPIVVAPPSIAQRLTGSQAAIVDAGPAGGEPVTNGTRLAGSGSARPADGPIHDTDLAYVIYTSGSTGTPKGVEITHAGLANLVSWHLQAFSVTPADRASHVAGLGFDAAVWELWPYLACGASVHLCDDLTRTSPELLRDWLVAKQITISFVATPLAERMLFLEWPRDTALRTVLTGGDVLHHQPPQGLPFMLVNNYGPTECTVVATSGMLPADYRPGSPPSIGRAITNTRIYLLDDQLRPVAGGSAGEIYIGGVSLARGYRNRPDLTAERFVPNPFAGDAGGRLYRTGDLAREMPDGQMEFLGRVDDQIKIRGYRIEPMEIVMALNRHTDVLDSLVAVRRDGLQGECLVAYLVLKPDSDVKPAALREFLRGGLPEYMLPSVFVRLGEFPLTPHGKIDRAALPEPAPSNSLRDEGTSVPLRPIEQRVTEIIARLLKRDQVGPDDDFFTVGGHSLLGAQLITHLRDSFGVQITLRALFTSPTARSLAQEIERLAETPAAPAEVKG